MNEFPTIRVGQPVPEGWLEYLHALLGQPTPQWHGEYDHSMAEYIKQYQGQHHLQVDGVVGDQTWAALLGEALPRDPAANEHYSEHRLDMRFTQEINYVDGDDVLFVRAMAVGTRNPSEGEVTLEVEVSRPDGQSHHVTATNEAYGSDTNLHTFYVRGPVADGPGGVYKALMWFAQELGQDNQTYEWNHVPR